MYSAGSPECSAVVVIILTVHCRSYSGCELYPHYSSVQRDDAILDQIVKQLAKLVDVRDIKVLDPSDSVVRETVLVKVAAAPEQRQGIVSIADIFRAKIVDVQEESMIIELTGTQSKLEGFMNLLKGYEILELARTGITGLSRGCEDVTYIG